MQRFESTIRQNCPTASRLAGLRAGDHVYVWDGARARNVWCKVADTKEVDGRLKIRITGTSFFFDEAIVISFAVNQEGADVRPELAPTHDAQAQNILEPVAAALHEARLRTLLALSRISDRTFDLNALTCARRNFEAMRAILDDALAGLDVQKEAPQFTLTAPDDALLFRRLHTRLTHANRIAQAGVTEATQADLRSNLASALDEAKLLLRAAAWREEIKP